MPPVMDREYLPGVSASDYLETMWRNHAHFAEVLDLSAESLAEAARWKGTAAEFDTDQATGRGDSYRRAQRDSAVRETGARTLLAAIACTPGKLTQARFLDVLGGDGLLARVWRSYAPRGTAVPILTGDVSGHMTKAAMGYALPAVCQPAQRLLVRAGQFDGVLLAYGTHHVPPADRPLAIGEAARVLRAGGRLAVHDFDQDSAVSRWFSHVVHRYSPAGHRYDHFTAAELAGYLTSANLVNVRVRQISDPFVVRRDDPQLAVDALLDYVAAMYGLRMLREECGDPQRVRERLRYLVDKYFTLTVRRTAEQYEAVMARTALMATGSKP